MKNHFIIEGSVAEIPTGDAAVIEAITQPGSSISKSIRTVLTSYGNRPALGWRRRVDGVLAPDFSFISYNELWEQVKFLSSAFVEHSDFSLAPGDKIATLGFAGPNYVALLLTAQYCGITYIPLSSNATPEQLAAIVDDVQPKALAVSIQQIDRAIQCALSCAKVQTIVVFDLDLSNKQEFSALDAARKKLAEAKSIVKLIPFSGAVECGENLDEVPPYTPANKQDVLNSIVYTSGSTGSPKGAMYTESNAIVPWASAPFAPPQITLHYQPLSHSYGSSYTFMTLARGGLVCFTAKSDLSTFLDDLALVRPTDMGFVPRICELLYQRACSLMLQGEGHDFEQLRSTLLGGRLRSAVIASAPLSSELNDFMEKLLGFPLTNSYGSTETGGISVNGCIQTPPVKEYKLIDVPELGYFSTDKPHPRGELVLKTDRLISGYYNRPKLNADLVDEDGFYHTGDIMEETAPGEIRFLDRRNNVLKLAQGEFVAISNLEALFTGSDAAIHQVFLYGNASRSFLLGVIVPTQEALNEAIDMADLKDQILTIVRKVAAKNNLNSYEIPRDIILETEPFSIENGLLAGVGKYMRPAILAKYQTQLDNLYTDIARAQDDALQNLKTRAKENSIETTVLQAVRVCLGLQDIPIEGAVSFADIGGDSLSAVSFVILLEDIFDIPIEVSDVLHPTDTLSDLTRKIGHALNKDAQARPICDRVHGEHATTLFAKDLTLDRFIAAKTLDDAKSLSTTNSEPPKTVLLTGANGFLGRFVAMEWLQTLSQNKGTLICLGRGADDDAVKNRLRETLVNGDEALKARFETLSANHLVCIAGDLSAPQLGLSDTRWSELADRVDVITHVGALVNHEMPYRHLFQTNVAGTAEIISLALTKRKKRIVDISTVAAAFNADGAAIGEDEDIRQAIPKFVLHDRYAVGYAASKWAAEVLLREGDEKFGLPVTVFRSNMILAHRQYRGQLNLPDIFSRLVLSLALTGIAPQSFYKHSGERAHYEGLPVDFIAKAVVQISEQRKAGYETYHTLNPHDDGVSLDSFVSWIEQQGILIERIVDYHEWKERFETALRALPEHIRPYTSLPGMRVYDEPIDPVFGASMPASNFTKAVTEIFSNAGGIPHLDESLIQKYLNDLMALGYLSDEPSRN